MSEIALVYIPFASRDEAEKVAREMITGRLAACVNILAEGQSIYPWAGTLESTAETVALFKTSPDRAVALISALETAHSYDVPAIIHWPAQTTAAYADWVHTETRPQVAQD
jgi:periplasmic divalent cation tolerance protein